MVNRTSRIADEKIRNKKLIESGSRKCWLSMINNQKTEHSLITVYVLLYYFGRSLTLCVRKESLFMDVIFFCVCGYEQEMKIPLAKEISVLRNIRFFCAPSLLFLYRFRLFRLYTRIKRRTTISLPY